MTDPAGSIQLIVNKAVTGFAVTAPDGLSRYLHEVLEWNSSLGLVSKRDPLAACERLLLESLEWDRVLALSDGMRVADVGSGAGFPGIVWALQHPGAEFVLLERRERRAAFLERVVRLLELSNATVRAEDVREHADPALNGSFDLVATMAVGDPADSARRLEWMLRDAGRFATTISRAREAPVRIGKSLELMDLRIGEFGRYATYRRGV